MGTAKYIGRVGALAVALGIGISLATTPAVAWAEPADSGTSSSSHAVVSGRRVVVWCVIDGRGDLRNRGRVGLVGLVAVDGVGIDREVDRIADQPGHITIGVVSSRDTVSRAGCGGEHRRRPHRLQDI